MTYEREDYMRRQEAGHDMIRMRDPHRSSRCPRCNSHSPRLHPAVQFGGEVEICANDFHIPLTEAADDQLDRKAASEITLFFLGNDSQLAEDIRTGKQARHFTIDVIRNRRLAGARAADTEAWLDDCENDLATRLKAKEILCSFNPELAVTDYLRESDDSHD